MNHYPNLLDRVPKTVNEAVSLMRRSHGHENALSVERRVGTLVLEEGDPVVPQVSRRRGQDH